MNEFRPILVGDVTPRAGNGSRCRWSSLASLACVLLQDFANQFGIDLKRCLCEGSQNGWQIHQPILGRANEHSQRSNDIERRCLAAERAAESSIKTRSAAISSARAIALRSPESKFSCSSITAGDCTRAHSGKAFAHFRTISGACIAQFRHDSHGHHYRAEQLRQDVDNVTMQQVIQRTCVGNNERHEDLSTLSSVIRSSSRSSVV